MAERATSEERLHRLLWMLPTATQRGGASLFALARELEIEPRQLMDDIEEATTRVHHHPPGTADPFSILIEADGTHDTRIEVHTTGEFQRPARLTSREALAVALGLRAMAAEVIPDRRDHMLDLAGRLEHDLAAPDVRSSESDGTARRSASRARQAEPEQGHAVREDAADDPGAAIETAIADAVVRRRACRIAYLKPRSRPEPRRIEPYRLLHAGGAWYVLGRDIDRDGMRLFRLDRIASAECIEDTPFDVPAAFDPSDYISEDGVPFFTTSEEEEVVVRYEAPAARWVAEEHGSAQDEDGRVHVRYRVADRRWLVRHVLGFGGAAVVIEPADVRLEVAEAAARVAGG